jgi:hypothetical protein
MKLRFSKNFGKRAGTCWRLIFVYALMPWLHKYRIMAREDKADSVQNLGDLEQQYPSLTFVSLRALNISADGSGNQESKEFRSRSGFARGSMVDKDKRVTELEEEVKRLKLELARASSTLDPPTVVTTSLSYLEPVVPPATENPNFVPSQFLPTTSKDTTIFDS